MYVAETELVFVNYVVLFSLTEDGFTGDVAHARLKFEEQLNNLDYIKVTWNPLYCRCITFTLCFFG
jgi:hypothetical protein